MSQIEVEKNEVFFRILVTWNACTFQWDMLGCDWACKLDFGAYILLPRVKKKFKKFYYLALSSLPILLLPPSPVPLDDGVTIHFNISESPVPKEDFFQLFLFLFITHKNFSTNNYKIWFVNSPIRY